MAIIVFLFGSVLGITGAIMQFALGFGLMAALQTYVFCAFGIPMVTLLAVAFRGRRDTDASLS